ncbi:sensor domain-containing diguanylate cyclase [Sphingomonas nostoxanthinifaciens]|uniref:sensor domain-containing diguanylate cyclase n=1 Tax=Sphingomonas nostoxanthinifaciens TaxID=2872652 RepID=UPI001CC206BB|nr:diguanylate cyclase [Sphingomonas nostoxanthinifaciens]UAK24829.1 diguanylate cyclase [Sphingomonas nostoxanthinifaciens]
MGILALKLVWQRLGLAVLTCVAILAAGLLSDHAVNHVGGHQALWPCDAIMLGLLVARGRDRRDELAIIAGGLLGGFLLNLANAIPPILAVPLALATPAAALTALALLRRFGVTRDIFGRVSDVLALGIACVGGASVSATFGAIEQWSLHGISFPGAWIDWYGAAFLGALMLVPMIAIGAQLGDRRHAGVLEGRSLTEVILLLGLTAIVADVVFFWTTLPLLFLVLPTVLLATFRLRAFGAAGAVAIVAVIATFATAHGHGPVVTHLASHGARALALQLFLSSCFLSALPIAALLSERERQAEETRLLAERLKTVIENIGEVIYSIDAAGNWSYLNPAWETLTGHPIASVIGQPWAALVDPDDHDELVERLAPVLAGRQRTLRRAVRFVTAGGPRWMELFIQALTAADGTPAGATGTLRDIDDRKRLEEHVMTAKRRAEQRAREATMLASTDELTGLANRRAFMQQLERELAGAAEFGWPLSVAMFDVDHFKSVNDRFGHAVGDRVLQLISARAGTAVRGGDLIGRLGGEEFGIIMPGATAEDAMVVAERLREAVESAPDDQMGLPSVTVSVGIAEREALRDPLALLAGADAALYAAKESGRNRVRLAA